jgi:hypothetical protein
MQKTVIFVAEAQQLQFRRGLFHGPTQRKFGLFRHVLGVTAFGHFE